MRAQERNHAGVTDNEFRDTSSNPELFYFASEESISWLITEKGLNGLL